MRSHEACGEGDRESAVWWSGRLVDSKCWVNTSMNKSELMLESWCRSKGWLCTRIPEDNDRTPDYKISIDAISIYAEVKEIIDNEEERRVIKQLAERGWSDAYGEEPGKTVREKIKESYQQIKRFASQDKSPGILVLYNNSGLAGLGRLDHYHVLTGMFGLQTVPVAVPRDPSAELTFGPDFFGPKKSVSDNRNRYLSGVMTLYEHYEKGLMAFFYHNPHAVHPLRSACLMTDNCIQFRRSTTELNWELIGNAQQGDGPDALSGTGDL